MKYSLFIITFILLVSSLACQQEGKNDGSNPPSSITTTPIDKPVPKPVKMKVYFDNLRLRDAAGKDGNEITKLLENSILTYQGELSNFTTPIKLRGMQYDEPWLKITTSDGKAGWVYAAGVKPTTTNPSEYISILENMRLESFFGKNLAEEIRSSNNKLTTTNSDLDFAVAYENALTIQEKINDVMADKIEIDHPQQLPSMIWLENAMEGFQNSLVAEGTKFYLFAHYYKLWQMAQKTSGNADDEFMQLQISIHPTDSIEHFFPVWFIQTWDYGGHSLLGEGHHFKILKKVNELLEKKSPFQKSLEGIKKMVLDDIFDTQKYVSYWYKKEKILSEIDDIIQANFVSLSSKDKIALKARRKMFEQHQANAIKINQRSGE